MNPLRSLFRTYAAAASGLVVALIAGCGGSGLDPILGTPVANVVPPTVVTVVPAAGATAVGTNSRVLATFSKAMTPATLNATTFTLACPAASAVAATVTYDTATNVATLTPTVNLPSSTVCVATITTGAKDVNGVALVAPFVWSFTTAALADTTRPTIVLTAPAPGATGVATNTRIAATFSEDMNASTILATSFTVTNTASGAAIPGTVSYAVAARTATFAPTAGVLASNTQFTATVSASVTDLAGNGLAGNTAVSPGAGNYVWTFTTGSTADTVPPTVTAINPLDGSTGVCVTKLVNATFSEAMDPATINTTTFGVNDGATAVAGTVSYDAPSRVASFTPSSAAGFAPSRQFVVTIKSGATGVKDLAGNALAVDRTWNFTTGTQPCATGVNLRSAASFGSFGGAAGVTNQGINTVVNGNLGTTAACTLITGFHDAVNVYTQTPLNVGGVNGTVYCSPPAPGTLATMATAAQALADAQSAYTDLSALPAGSDPGAGQLGGLVLAPAVYTSAGGTFAITTGDLTLDAQGDPNAVWVFQSSAALTVGLSATPRRVILINGAQAKNVYWRVGSAARIEDGSTMVGTIIAPAGVTISTAGQTAQTTLIGRALALVASVTMVNTTIVAP